MLTKNRIKLLIALGIILIIGFTNTIFHLRPVSDRKKNKFEKLDTKKELQNALIAIKLLTDSIAKDSSSPIMHLKRARYYKSINKFNEAIVDYNKFLKNNTNSSLGEKAKSELKSCVKIQKYYNKIKS